MLRSLILVALRNIRRDVTYSLINFIWLTIGITGSIIFILYVFDDLSYDRYHEKSDQINYLKNKDLRFDKDNIGSANASIGQGGRPAKGSCSDLTCS